MIAELDADIDAVTSGDEQATETSPIAAVHAQISANNRRPRSLISELTSLEIVNINYPQDNQRGETIGLEPGRQLPCAWRRHNR